MPVWACFSYSADLPPSVTNRSAAPPAPRGLGSMPGYPCFAYPDDMPRAVSSPQRMPLTCFSFRAADADMASRGTLPSSHRDLHATHLLQLPA